MKKLWVLVTALLLFAYAEPAFAQGGKLKAQGFYIGGSAGVGLTKLDFDDINLLDDSALVLVRCRNGVVVSDRLGEIARQTANLVAKNDGYARACHGELFSVPHADLAKWVREADKVVVIDGCSLFCHGRIAENIIDADKLININALPIHGKYADLMDVDDVEEEERKQTARETADKILANLREGISCCTDQQSSCGCESAPQPESTCCSA